MPQHLLHHCLRALLLLAIAVPRPVLAQDGNAPPANSGAQPAVEDASRQAKQESTAAPATPLPTPSITGPLQASPPITFEAGPLGKLNLNGIVSGVGFWQGNHVASDDPSRVDLSGAQLFLQKTSGWWQFYVQVGGYSIVALGTPFIPTQKAVSDLY